MNRYQPPSALPRTAFAIAALALTALTIGLGVIAPSTQGPGVASALLARDAGVAPVEVTIIPARIDVIAVREAQPGSGEARAAADQPRGQDERS